MQTHTDRRSPSQVKVGHRGGAEQGKVQALTRFFHDFVNLEIRRAKDQNPGFPYRMNRD